MSHGAQLVLYSALTIVGIVVLIMRFKLDPVIALFVGAVVLGIAGGLSVDDAIQSALTGFGDLMAEIGLLIAFGVLLGALLSYMGAIDKLVNLLMRTFGPKSMPYSFGVTIGIVLPAIFVDVMLVIVAPIARAVAPKIGAHGVARIATAIAIGLECGLTMMIPGVAALALSGLLNVPLGTMLLYGSAVAAATILTSICIMNLLFRAGFWSPDKDEQPHVEVAGKVHGGPVDSSDDDAGDGTGTRGRANPDDTPKPGASPDGAVGPAPVLTATAPERPREPRLALALAPLIGGLLLVALGAVTEAVGWEYPVVDLFSNPTVALLLGLVSAGALARRYFGRDESQKAVGSGFRDLGQILVLTGVGGCLAQVVKDIGLGEVLQDSFSAHTTAPLLLVWLIGAVLHMAISSVTTSAITAAGLLAPIAGSLGVDPVLVALAAGTGAMFAIHVTSNTFWLMQSLLGQTTRGTLKTCSLGVSVASVVGLGYTLLLNLAL